MLISCFLTRLWRQMVEVVMFGRHTLGTQNMNTGVEKPPPKQSINCGSPSIRNSMYIQIKSIKPKVIEILEHSQSARNSDKDLILQVWESCGLILDEKQKEIWKNLPSSESIRRTRQKLQELGKYKADHEIIKAREENRKNMEITMLRQRISNPCEVCGEQALYPSRKCNQCI